MKKSFTRKNIVAMLAVAMIMALAQPVLWSKPAWAGGKAKGGKHEHREKHESHHDGHDDHGGYAHEPHHSDVTVNIFFGDRQRGVVRSYFTEQYHSGHCPPGLVKKNNGCMPPGQAKKWRVGRPLPSEVVYYELPPAVVVQLGPPPPQHHFVRVASDILLIAEGTGMIVDAIADLGRID